MVRIDGMTNPQTRTLQDYGAATKRLLQPLIFIVAIMWFVELIDWLFFSGALDRLGIVPRQLAGLQGVILAPWLHGSFGHLLANTLPFLVLGFLVMLRHRRQFAAVSLVIILISGLGTWLIAPAHTIHIGASGLIFGYFAFLLVTAWYERGFSAIALVVLVIALYGGIVWGILPQANGVSWQGHLFGLIGGALAARYVNRREYQIAG